MSVCSPLRDPRPAYRLFWVQQPPTSRPRCVNVGATKKVWTESVMRYRPNRDCWCGSGWVSTRLADFLRASCITKDRNLKSIVISWLEPLSHRSVPGKHFFHLRVSKDSFVHNLVTVNKDVGSRQRSTPKPPLYWIVEHPSKLGTLKSPDCNISHRSRR